MAQWGPSSQPRSCGCGLSPRSALEHPESQRRAGPQMSCAAYLRPLHSAGRGRGPGAQAASATAPAGHTEPLESHYTRTHPTPSGPSVLACSRAPRPRGRDLQAEQREAERPYPAATGLLHTHGRESTESTSTAPFPKQTPVPTGQLPPLAGLVPRPSKVPSGACSHPTLPAVS